MRTVEARTGDFAQHAGEAAATPNILLPLLRARSISRITALLRVGDGRNGDGQSRNYGEDEFPHHRFPKAFRHPLIKRAPPFFAS